MKTISTVFHAYNYDTRKPEELAAYKELRARLADGPHQMHSFGEYYHPEIDGRTIELETAFLFDNQWNTAPIDGFSDQGYRLFDWAEEYLPHAPKIKRGHWLEQTDEMRAIRRETSKCGYCGKQYLTTPENVFCFACLDSPYLKETELHLLRLLPIDSGFNAKREPLADDERAEMMPRYLEAQTKGASERGRARLANTHGRSRIPRETLDLRAHAELARKRDLLQPYREVLFRMA